MYILSFQSINLICPGGYTKLHPVQKKIIIMKEQYNFCDSVGIHFKFYKPES